MKIDHFIARELSSRLKSLYPELPQGKFWAKYDKERIYFNEKGEDVNYTFFLDFGVYEMDVRDVEEEYWFPKLSISKLDEFLQVAYREYYSILFPPDDRLPVETVKDISKYAMFEAVILQEDEEKVSVNVLPFDYRIEVSRDTIDSILKTNHRSEGVAISRINLIRSKMEETIVELDRLEDEEDAMIFANLQGKSASTYVIDTPKEDRSSEILVDEGTTRSCMNCKKQFTSYASADEDFCSQECKHEFQTANR